MTNIINQWIQSRLGIIMNWNAETFCRNTRDGHLLSRILKSYEVINEEQLGMIHKTEVRANCMQNFKFIAIWLKTLGISLDTDEVDEIVDYTGLGSINIFYKLFLELHEKDNLTFITQQRLNEKLHPQNTRFAVKSEAEETVRPPQVEGKYKSPLIESYDVIHWHQDRLEMLVNKCKSAREEYMGMVRTRDKRLSSSSFSYYSPASPDFHRTEEANEELINESVKSIDLSYEKLIEEQKKANMLKQFQADPKEAKTILKKYKEQVKKKAENAIFQKQLHKEVLNAFWQKIRDEENDECDKDITEKMLKQSLYEKQMLRKLGEVKFQKDVMIQNKLAISDAILKEKEAQFVEQFLEEDKELNDKEFQYYLNKEKTLKLHRKIYEEKLRLKSERCYKMCSEIIRNICTIAFKESEYRNFFGESPSRRVIDNWKKCFLTNENFEDAVSPIEIILKPPDEIPEDLETIVHNEIERQDKLDKGDFESYINFEWPWELENVEIDDNYICDMNYGMNILGHIVNNLLKIKYPLPEPPPPPNLPKVNISVCVNGLTDTTCLPLLQKMLDHKDIRVFEMQDAVNFCINAFKEESKLAEEDGDEQIQKDKTKGSQSKKSLKKGAKSKSKTDRNINTVEDVEDKFALADKTVQTPKVYPCEEIPLSPKAELGRIAEEELSRGSSLTDHLLVHMFLEFLRPKHHLKGWVLVNYPETLEQAILLEESLTGITIPGYFDTLKVSRSIGELAELEANYDDRNMDIYEQYRSSKILKNPQKAIEDGLSYDSALTAFIQIIQTTNERNDNTVPNILVEDLENRTSPLEIFYSDLGCNYSLYYEHFDYYTVKSLGKLIIGDYSIPPKTSIELFGDSIRYIDAEKIDLETIFRTKSVKSVKKGDKKETIRKEKVVKSKSKLFEEETKTDIIADKKKGMKDKTDQSGHVLIVHSDKFTQIPEVIVEEVEEEEELEKVSIEPGSPGWKYTDLKLADELQVALATLWENAEEVYIEDFSQVLFMKRIILNAIMPKVNYVKIHMNKYINSPDDKQMYLRKFQQLYNEFDADIRSDVEFKAELHCRVNELREKLIGVCDQQMMEAEQARCLIVNKKWAPRQLVELINNYINGFQLEIDRHVDTLTLVSDYYAGIVTKLPVQESLAKEALSRLDLLDSGIEQAVCDVLLRVDEDLGDPFSKTVEQIYGKASAFSNKCQSWAWSCLEKVKSVFSPHVEKQKEKQSKKNKSIKGDISHPTIFEPNNEVKQNSEKLFEEWKRVLTGETARLTICLKLLRHDLEQNLQQNLNTVKKNMLNVYEDIRSKYTHEVSIVNNVCNFLARAIEAAVPLQEELVFKDGEFYLNPQHIFFPDEVPPEQTSTDLPEDLFFTIPQLEKMTEILFDLAPSGYIPERIFVYLLQDMVIEEEESVMPRLWSRMSPENITQLSRELFGRQELVRWKDFIVYNLVIPFPSAEDILRLRKCYSELDSDAMELINEEQYESVDLWFEDTEGGSRNGLIKQLIFKMYKVTEEYFNYTAMLFYFCKGESIPAGIAKALALSMGKVICWDNEIGNKFVEATLEERKIHEEEVRTRNEERRQNQEFAECILQDVVNEVVHGCDSVIIEDLTPTEDEETRKNSLQEIISSAEVTLCNGESPEDEEETTGSIIKNDNSTVEVLNVAEDKFSNLAIGFENCDDTVIAHFITLHSLIQVFAKTLPPSQTKENLEDESFSEKLENIFEECRNAQFNNEVLSHDILNNTKFLDLLNESFNFQIKNPPKIVAKLIETNENIDV
ncbi:unnamed protein product [Phaedon cochleariae]|uniref:Sperm flagellar protein 2 n=1 Tax=Phaedon cochleariae TaxID=80249 RepID=A0A9N9SBX8_PHACE|nr:unnamed protein product [Phaedon cochleariae]